jgi:hypothetical protein
VSIFFSIPGMTGFTMIKVNTESLSESLDSFNRAVFYNEEIPVQERIKLSRWIAELQGKTGSYAGMFAPTSKDFSESVKVFTGELIKSKAGISHVLGEEACRALILMNIADHTVKDALATATKGILLRLRQSETTGDVQGLYCCGKCSVSYWRHIIVGGLDKNEERLVAGMRALKSCRTGDARWRRFPFFYTLLALSEMEIPPAIDEMRYAAPLLERYRKTHSEHNEYAKRRRLLCERVLAKC